MRCAAPGNPAYRPALPATRVPLPSGLWITHLGPPGPPPGWRTPASSTRIFTRIATRTSPPSSCHQHPDHLDIRDYPACFQPHALLHRSGDRADRPAWGADDARPERHDSHFIGAVTYDGREKRAHQRGHPDHRQCRRHRHRRRRPTLYRPGGLPRRRSRRGRHRLRPAPNAGKRQSRDDGLPPATRGARRPHPDGAE